VGATKSEGRFFACREERDAYARRLKTRACPGCGAVGFLICHGFLKGYAPSGDEKVVRGFRFYCSKRRRDGGGCGETYSILLSDVLPRRSTRAPQLWSFFKTVLRGLSRSVAWRREARRAAPSRPPFSLSHAYRLWARLKAREARIREWVCREAPLPSSDRRGALFQLLEHLNCVFGNPPCPITAWQEHFQSPFPL